MYGIFGFRFRMTSDRLCIMDCLASFAMTRNVVIATLILYRIHPAIVIGIIQIHTIKIGFCGIQNPSENAMIRLS
ncbi:hypothetical protein [Helicobacter fennelliae]|uniref:hypothetical protein n=1 Tax=Helicobacter fennelliae TaxID=215 RepID=UPI0011BEDA7C|nr:hypothetical protein [Helicobacter fennelliae]